MLPLVSLAPAIAAQATETPPLDQQCDERSTAILTSFAYHQERVAEMLGLEEDCAGTGIYEAKLAQLYAETGDFDEGNAVAMEALEFESAYEHEILVALVHLGLQEGAREQATTYAARLVTDYPDLPRSKITAARVLQATFRHEAAFALLEEANEIEESGEAHLVLSALHYQNRRYEESAASLETALTLDPSLMRHTEFVSASILSLIELDRRDEARALRDRHMETFPQARRSHYAQFLEEKLSKRFDGPGRRSMISSSSSSADEQPPAPEPDTSGLLDMIDSVWEESQDALFAVYQSALTRNPDLAGWITVRLSIHPDGHMEECRILRSELDDDRLLNELCDSILLIRFEPFNTSGPVTTSRSIEFVPD